MIGNCVPCHANPTTRPCQTHAISETANIISCFVAFDWEKRTRKMRTNDATVVKMVFPWRNSHQRVKSHRWIFSQSSFWPRILRQFCVGVEQTLFEQAADALHGEEFGRLRVLGNTLILIKVTPDVCFASRSVAWSLSSYRRRDCPRAISLLYMGMKWGRIINVKYIYHVLMPISLWWLNRERDLFLPYPILAQGHWRARDRFALCYIHSWLMRSPGSSAI